MEGVIMKDSTNRMFVWLRFHVHFNTQNLEVLESIVSPRWTQAQLWWNYQSF